MNKVNKISLLMILLVIFASLFFAFQNNFSQAADININANVGGVCTPTTTTCGAWSTCASGLQTRSCSNGCTTTTQSQTCGGGKVPFPPPSTECTPGFTECGEWSACQAGQQHRQCSNGCSLWAEYQFCGECQSGQTRQCGQSDVGECQFGQQQCVDGFWVGCEGAIYPIVELCFDNLDNDCDGEIDQGCGVCVPLAVRQCGQSDIGLCQYGLETCQQDRLWGECFGAVDPQEEICGDDIDNDCDGQTDEGCICNPDWQCQDWSVCYNQVQIRECIDLNDCDDLSGMPDVIRSCLPECLISCKKCQTLDIERCLCLEVTPCCGNQFCEDKETASSCPVDCPAPPSAVKFACSDNIDNDNDGLIDFPNDPGCRDDLDDSEVDIKEKIKEADIVGAVEEVIDSVKKSALQNVYINKISRSIVEITYELRIYRIIIILLLLLLLLLLLYILYRRLKDRAKGKGLSNKAKL